MNYCPNPKCPFLLQMKQPAEYRDEIKTCVDCGTALVAEDVISAQKSKPKSVSDEPIVTVAIYNSVLEAHVGRSKLEQAGIPSFVADEHMGSLSYPAINTIGGIRLQALESNYQAALEILSAVK